MPTILVSILLAGVTALLGGVGTYMTTRRNLETQYDANLRELRIGAYQKLWSHLRVISKYGREPTIDRRGVRALNHKLTAWYYEEGGMFLSDSARHEYFALQDALEMLARDSDREPPSAAEDQFVVVLGSRLRTALTRDVGTRKTFMLESEGQPLREARTQSYTASADGGAGRLELRRSWAPWRWRHPTLTASGGATPTSWRWRPERSGFTNDADGAPCTRVAFLEGDRLIEGPTAWSRLETEAAVDVREWQAVTTPEGGSRNRDDRAPAPSQHPPAPPARPRSGAAPGGG